MIHDILHFVLNHEEFLQDKDELMYSLKRYFKACQNDNVIWSSNRKSQVLQLLKQFIAKVSRMNLPKVATIGWFYIYTFESDGLYLRLQHCTDIVVDADEEMSSYEIDYSFDLFKEPYVYLSVVEYAKLYEVTDVAVRQWIRRGKLRSAVKRGGEWYIPSIEDRPKRGYEGAEYQWNESIPELEERFPYLTGKRWIAIDKSSTLKGMYSVWSNGEIACLEAKNREILELALIEHPGVKSNVDFDYDILHPEKKNELLIRGGRIMSREESTLFENDIAGVLQENIEFQIFSSRNNYGDLDVWEFGADMFLSDFTGDDEKKESVLQVTGGMILPSSVEGDHSADYYNIVDFCDSISGDLLMVANAVFDIENGGIKLEMLKESDTEWLDSCIRPVMYIHDISYMNIKYLQLFLKRFNGYAEGFPCASNCQLAMVLLNWEREQEKVMAYIDAGWKTQKCDEGALVVYKWMR